MNVYIERFEKVENRIKWDIGKLTNWDLYKETLEKNWTNLQQEIAETYNFDKIALPDRKHKLCEEIYEKIIKIYIKSAEETIGHKDTNRGIWKPWITKASQKVSIQFHKYERWFMNQKHRTNKMYQKYRKLRSDRNKEMKYHKRRWIEYQFSIHKLQGKEGWRIASELRDLNKNITNIIPTITTKNNEIISSNKVKAELFLEHYHRFDELPTLDTNMFFEKHIHDGYESDDYEEIMDDLKENKQDTTDLYNKAETTLLNKKQIDKINTCANHKFNELTNGKQMKNYKNTMEKLMTN